jgi:hypothetical protein
VQHAHDGNAVLAFAMEDLVGRRFSHSIGPTHTEGRFTLTADDFSAIANPLTLNYFGTLPPLFPGSTALFHHISLGEIALARSGGGLLDLNALALAELPAGDANGNPINPGPFGVTCYGLRADGSTVTQTVTVDSFLTLMSHALAGFTGLESVH